MTPDEIIAAQQRVIDEQNKLILHLQGEVARLSHPLHGYPAPSLPNPWTTPIQPRNPTTSPWEYPGTVPIWCGGYPTTSSVVVPTVRPATETGSPCG
jgi:hypothetical protein